MWRPPFTWCVSLSLWFPLLVFGPRRLLFVHSVDVECPLTRVTTFGRHYIAGQPPLLSRVSPSP